METDERHVLRRIMEIMMLDMAFIPNHRVQIRGGKPLRVLAQLSGAAGRSCLGFVRPNREALHAPPLSEHVRCGVALATAGDAVDGVGD